MKPLFGMILIQSHMQFFIRFNNILFWVQKGCDRGSEISSWCNCSDRLHPWGIQLPIRCQSGWCGNQGAGFPVNKMVIYGNTEPVPTVMAMKMTNGKVRHEPRAQLHTHPSTLTPQTHWHIPSRNQDNWRRLSDSPWGRSNWTLDILAWKEHTRSVRQNHIKGTDIPLRPSKSRIRVWCHIKTDRENNKPLYKKTKQ